MLLAASALDCTEEFTTNNDNDDVKSSVSSSVVRCCVVFQSSAASSCGDDVMTVDAVLQKLGLGDYVDRFHAEQIDLDALVCTSTCLISCVLFLHLDMQDEIFNEPKK